MCIFVVFDVFLVVVFRNLHQQLKIYSHFCLALDPLMISNLVFMRADDLVDCFKEPCAGGCRDTML